MKCNIISAVFGFLCVCFYFTGLSAQNILLDNVLKIDFVLQDFLQDDDGFFWLASANGLFRYDGQKTRYFSSATRDLEHNNVTALAKDKEGRIWMATYGGGLTVYDKSINRFKTFRHLAHDPSSIAGNHLTSIFVDRQGNVWAGTDTLGISVFKPAENRFYNYAINYEKKQLIQDQVLKEEFITGITQDRSGAIWIGVFSKGAIRVNPDTLFFDHFLHEKDNPNTIGGNHIFSILADDKGLVWLGGDEAAGLSKYDPETNQISHYRHEPGKSNSISYGNIREIFRRNNQLWLGHFFGSISVIDLDTGKIQRVLKGDPIKNNLRSDTITKIMTDSSGIFWIACLSGELEKYNPSAIAFNSYENDPKDPDSLNSNVIMTIFGDSRNYIWIGTGTGGLNRLDRKTGKFKHYTHDKALPGSLPATIVTHIFEDSLQRVWVSVSNVSNAFFCQFDEKTDQFIKIYQHQPDIPDSPAKGQRIRAVLEDKDQPGVLWLSYDNSFFDRFDTRSQTFIHYELTDIQEKDAKPEIWDMLQDEGGKLWFSTQANGLLSFNPKNKEFQSFHHIPGDRASLTTNQLFGMRMDSQKRFWIGTNSGFVKFDPETGQFKSFSLEKTLYKDNTILGIVEDMAGDLWLPTNGGLARFNPETGAVKIFTKEDGLQSNAFFFKAFCRAPGGELWFGGLNGVNSFFPEQHQQNPHVPEIVLTAIKTGNEELKFDQANEKIKEIRLGWKNNFFEFEYAGLEYTQPHLNQYRYKLEGLDTDWVEAGNRNYGRYSGLPGGNYLLRIMGSNNEGVWNPRGVTLSVIVEDPFWKTRGFYLLISTAAMALFAMIFFYIFRLQREVQTRKITQSALLISREDLNQSNKFLEAVVRQAPFGIEVLKISKDKWNMLLVNEEACRIKLQPELEHYRTGRGELHTWTIVDSNGEPFEFARSSVIESIRNRIFTEFDELEIIRSDWSSRWITYNVSPIIDEKDTVAGGLIVYSDITKKKLAEDKTLKIKNQLNQIIDMMPSVIIGIDDHHHITHWNRHAAEMTSLIEENVTGRDFFSIFPASAELLHMIRHTIEKKRVLQMDKMNTVISDISRIINLTVYPFGINEIDGYVIKIDDISNQVKIEELAIQNEKMIMIAGLAAGMAHEINNPLSAILQGAQNIARRLSPDLEPNRKAALKHQINLEHLKAYLEEREIDKFLEALRNSSVRASRIVSNMLHFSRRSREGVSRMSIHTIIDRSIELAANDYELKHKYGFHRIRIIRNYSHELPDPVCDETQMEQVFINLFKNSAHALCTGMESGACGPNDPVITITTKWVSPDIHIRFQDNGPGMPKEMQKKIFEPFFTTKGPQEGTGLGLFVSFIIITSVHKGTLTVESDPGRGTTFDIRIPASSLHQI